MLRLSRQNEASSSDLVVETLSHSTESRDRKLKRARYQAAGVPEYWIVDPFAQRIEQLVLKEGIYESLTPSAELQLTIIENVNVCLNEVWSSLCDSLYRSA